MAGCAKQLRELVNRRQREARVAIELMTVSYTHLTLPTILLV